MSDLSQIPPWLQIQPSLFTSAMESGASVGLQVAAQSQRAQELAAQRAEKESQDQERQAQEAERQRQFDESHLLNVQKVTQDAAQLQQQVAHQTALEANQRLNESRLLNYDTGRLAVENRRADIAEQGQLPSAMDTTLVPAVDPDSGERVGLLSRSGPRTQRYIPDRATGLNPAQEVAGLRARSSALEQQYMINNPPKGSPEEKRIQDALLTIDQRLEELTTGKGGTAKGASGAATVLAPAPAVGVTKPVVGVLGQGTRDDPARPETAEQFDSMLPGTIYKNPKDGQLYRKK